MRSLALTIAVGLFFVGNFSHAALDRRASDIRPMLEGERPLGQGILISRKAPLLRLCGKARDFESEGMNFDYELTEIKKLEDYYVEDVEIKKFLVQSLKAAKEHNIEGLERFDLYLKLKFDHGGRALPDGPEFLPYARKFLEQGELDKFFRLCGHNFVHSIRGASHLHLFMSYYAPNKKIKEKLKETLRNRLGTHDLNDIFRLRVFSELNFDGYIYSRIHSTTGSGLLLWEPGLSQLGRNDVDQVLEDIFRRLAQEGETKANYFSYQPWAQLEKIKNACRQKQGDFKKIDNALACNEGQHAEVKLLGREVLSYTRKLNLSRELRKVKGEHRERAERCYRSLKPLQKTMNWRLYKQCRKKVGNQGDFRLVEECQRIRQIGFRVMHNSDCSSLPYKVGKRKFYYTDKLDTPQQGKPRENIPHKLGRGVNLEGEIKWTSCVKPQSKSQVRVKHADSTTQEYHPLKEINRRDQSFIHFRAVYQREDLNNALAPNFSLNAKAKRALEKGLHSFYEECGTHFVRRRLSRKGIVLDLLFPKDDLIFKGLLGGKPGPIQLARLNKLLNPNNNASFKKKAISRKNIRIAVKPYGLNESNTDHPVFEIESFDQYLKRKGAINKIIETDDGKGQLVKFIAAPWNNYLLVYQGFDLNDL